MPTGEHCWKKNSGTPWARTGNLWIPSLTRSPLRYFGRYVKWDLNTVLYIAIVCPSCIYFTFETNWDGVINQQDYNFNRILKPGNFDAPKRYVSTEVDYNLIGRIVAVTEILLDVKTCQQKSGHPT